ncbi:ThiF family protein [Geodermatophilus dictyosporus]|uniref:ThiF family protein n=1 Tax=Geodermatophilus dictyosporus TaxID=1523247 RepID=A0A1I5L485_9ACTN|nr:ThiF family adenylyltransferase [Geodermatophilus dictyosporus]SFO92084.1 ThiF family protein [Geodermatophilus dictyosporus]
MSDATHPLLPPGTPLLRRSADALQVGGIDGADGLLVGTAPDAVTTLLRGLDGRRAQRAVLADAGAAGLDPGSVTDLLAALRGAGALVDLEAADLLASDAGPAATVRAAAELAAARDGTGSSRWHARRGASVVVEGATRVGVPVAALLAASGVGRVSVRDTGVVTAGDAVPGGLAAGDEGRPRATAAADAVRRAAPLTDLRPPAPGALPDLVVLARPWAASDPLVAGLRDAGVAHLVAAVRGETGVAGPLVVPGVTSCLRCADLHRRDADPAWPVLAAQLTAADGPPSGAALTCWATALAAAQQALAYLDGSGSPAALSAVVELRPPDLAPRLRRWPPHPACGCTAAARPPTAPGEDAPGSVSGPGAPQGTMAR